MSDTVTTPAPHPTVGDIVFDPAETPIGAALAAELAADDTEEAA